MATAADPVGKVYGSGFYGTTKGEFPNHQPFLDKVTVNATLYADGSADGTMVWASVYNGNPFPGQEPRSTWQIRVESWNDIGDGFIVLAGTVTHSQFEEEVGLFAAGAFKDGGKGNPDYFSQFEIKGNFVIEFR